ncbi:protease m1 zinc metalloprotease [Anopheles darlingi]|uniref:Aminopeptidase N n=1 Tax=Anopheles darlingi TaxID=43151 RepID=W5JDG1_ANODA|nr:protease m1 zinc metalloprotease [Anopheles darlingi]
MVRPLVIVSIGLWCLLGAGELLAERPPFKTDAIHAEEEEPVPSAEQAIVPAQDVDESYRLPQTSIPIHYAVHLTTNIHRNERTFTGTVAIKLQVVEPTDNLVLHQLGLQLSTAKISSLPAGIDGPPTLIGDVTFATDTRVAHLTLTSPSVLLAGYYLLEIDYSGRLSTDDDGFYVSSYVADNGERRYLATTQFESTSARRAFPCYDEPALKATFTITITHGSLYGAISNMPEDTRTVNGEMATTKFETTPLMSTYLIAFVVSDFLRRGDNQHRVFARPNAFQELPFALEASRLILQVLDDHLGVPYTNYMEKIDQVALPDFAAGAMENWGLVTYREQLLLFNPEVNSYRTKTNIATTISHEYAHQWFGDLVTPQWWEYIWLNEGFATLYEYLATDLAYPGMEYWELFNTQVIQAAMVPDGLASTRPMNYNAATPGEISALFDRVAYPKSGSVLNMMRHVLGDDNWRAGLRTYLLDRALNKATDEDLYRGLQSAIEGKGVLPDGVTVGQIMRTWTNEAGYPVLNVRRSYDTGEIIISQERFYSDRKIPNTNIWMIPYNYVHQAVADFNEFDDFKWLATKADRFTTTVPAHEWIIFNKQEVGYYRVNYDDHNWELITNALHECFGCIHRLNRAQLIDDAYWLARSGRLDLRIALRLMTYLHNEREYSPWAAADVALSYFNSRLRGTEAYEHFTTFVHSLTEPLYSLLNIDAVDAQDTLLHKYLVQTISSWACRLDHPDCLARTKTLLTSEASGRAMVHADLSTVTYCYGMRTAGEQEYQYVYRKMMDSKNLVERTMLIDALGCSWNKEYLHSFIMTALGNTEINYRADERRRVIQAVYSGSRAGVDTLIEFLSNAQLTSEFVSTLGQSTLSSTLSAIASRTNNAAEMAQLNALITTLGDRVNPTTATNLRNSAQANLDWVNGFEGLMLTDFLAEYVKDLQTTTTTAQPTTTTVTVTTSSTTQATNPPITTSPAPPMTTTGTAPITTTQAQQTTTEDDDGGAATVTVSLAALLLAIATHLLG